MKDDNRVIIEEKDIARQWFDELNGGDFAGVAAQPGIGKTAFLVQLAVAQTARGRRVLHVSLADSLKKVDLWYREMVLHFCRTQPECLPIFAHEERAYRFIMTFQAERFSVPRLEERFSELKDQNIFHPDLLIIDGLVFTPGLRSTLETLKEFARRQHLRLWFTIPTPLGEILPDGTPSWFAPLEDLFSLVWQIKEREEKHFLQALKGAPPPVALRLNPTTMLMEV